MVTTRFLLDTMIYDRLAADTHVREALARLIAAGDGLVITTPTIRDQLQRGPFPRMDIGVPLLHEGESVLLAGSGRVGDRVGSGDVMRRHKGASRQLPDALIADAASTYADFLVTEDKRLRNRLAQAGARCAGMTYAQFREWLSAL